MMENLPRSGMVDENMLLRAFQAEDVDARGYITRTQLYQLLIENGNDPLTKEEVDEMMEDCGSGDRFCYTGNYCTPLVNFVMELAKSYKKKQKHHQQQKNKKNGLMQFFSRAISDYSPGKKAMITSG